MNLLYLYVLYYLTLIVGLDVRPLWCGVYVCNSFCCHKQSFLQPPSLEGDEVVWVRLVVVEHNIHLGIVYFVHHTVTAVVWLTVSARRRNLHVAASLSVDASQDSGHKH